MFPGLGLGWEAGGPKQHPLAFLVSINMCSNAAFCSGNMQHQLLELSGFIIKMKAFLWSSGKIDLQKAAPGRAYAAQLAVAPSHTPPHCGPHGAPVRAAGAGGARGLTSPHGCVCRQHSAGRGRPLASRREGRRGTQARGWPDSKYLRLFTCHVFVVTTF